MDTRAFALIRKHKDIEYLDPETIRSERADTIATARDSTDKAIELVVVSCTVVRRLESI